MRHKLKAILTNFFYVLLLLIVAAVAFIAWQWRGFQNEPLPVTSNRVFILKPGLRIEALTKELVQQGIIDKPSFFIWWAMIHGEDKKLKAGEYAITTHMTAPQLLHNFSEGKVIMWRVTFPEGWTFRQMLAALEKNPHLTHSLQDLDDKSIMEKLGHAKQHPEGLFFPDTYFFSGGTPDTVILAKAYAKMQQKLTKVWDTRVPDLPYQNAYQALIVASLVEREAKLASERSQIAGVIIRRLQKNMRLQIDPTVIYGLDKPYSTRLTKNDLHNDSAYNTYLHEGLPPTPICMPSMSSIYAALHPDNSDALYFVSNADGSHRFSATLFEHNKAVASYKKKLAVKATEKNEASKPCTSFNYLQTVMPLAGPYPVCR